MDRSEIDFQAQTRKQILDPHRPRPATRRFGRLDQSQRHLLRRAVPVRRPPGTKFFGDAVQQGRFGRSGLTDVERARRKIRVDDQGGAGAAEQVIPDPGEHLLPRSVRSQRSGVEPEPLAAQAVQRRPRIGTRLDWAQHPGQLGILRLRVAHHEAVRGTGMRGEVVVHGGEEQIQTQASVVLRETLQRQRAVVVRVLDLQPLAAALAPLAGDVVEPVPGEQLRINQHRCRASHRKVHQAQRGE
ncbi:hypothetical protein J7E96_28680 [Streptomyces sp. ISL-96]|uniref:hypothetical protein n=1 Tax=Streptomyces sp. ISL-96 TaxID=2819191 RepID=UPI001BE73B9B|nr:hypothetical protein [Streptomyces sp. ISL-96]MBT2492416.1 hypothetical protein [Streptomyces sp. ISL-96]